MKNVIISSSEIDKENAAEALLNSMKNVIISSSDIGKENAAEALLNSMENVNTTNYILCSLKHVIKLSLIHI